MFISYNKILEVVNFHISQVTLQCQVLSFLIRDPQLACYPRACSLSSQMAPVALGIIWPHMTTFKVRSSENKQQEDFPYLSLSLPYQQGWFSKFYLLDSLPLSLFCKCWKAPALLGPSSLLTLLDDFRHSHALKRYVQTTANFTFQARSHLWAPYSYIQWPHTVDNILQISFVILHHVFENHSHYQWDIIHFQLSNPNLM